MIIKIKRVIYISEHKDYSNQELKTLLKLPKKQPI